MTASFPSLIARATSAVDEVPDSPSLLPSALVVFALGVVMAVQSVPLMAVALADVSTHSIRFATSDGAVSVASAAPFNLAFTVAVAFAPWLAITAVTHVGARLAGGSGTVSQSLAVVARCAIPWIAAYALVVLVAGVVAVTSEATVAAVLGGHALESVPGTPPAYFDGNGLLDLRAWLFVAAVALSARIWSRAVPSVHGAALERGSAVVAAAVVVLLVPVILL